MSSHILSPFMTLRSTLLSLALAGTLVPGIASAQSLTARVPVTSAETLSLDGTSAPQAAASPSNLLAACTAGQTVTQAAVTGATFNALTGNTAGTGGTPQELGQSFTAPCDGALSTFAFIAQSSVASQPLMGTLTLYSGAGTAGTLLRAVPFAFTLPAANAAYSIPIALPNPITVATGQIITAFIDISGTQTQLQLVSPGTYPDGAMYFSSTGTSAGALIQGDNTTGDDLRFTSTFSPTNTAVTAATPTVYNGAGWRLLSPPVAGITVDDLARQNLVQGFGAGDPANAFPAQYPTASATPGQNLLTAYNGAAFLVPANTGIVPQSGRGFFWYWYDQAITPNPTSYGGGTSTSRELTGYTLSATGITPAANVVRQVATSSDGAYMLGNPFNASFQLSGLTQTAGGGTLGTVFSVFDPSINNYVTLGPTNYVSVWQGFFVDVVGATNPTFTYAIASRSATATPFYGRTAETGVRFRLDGATTAGETHDLAAQVRFLADAEAGRDRHDGSKLLPPGGAYALLAPVAAAERLSVNSLPEATDAADVALAFLATNGGTFTLSWDADLAGRQATLHDAVTGATVDLATAVDYTFTSDATEWTERFTLTLGRGAVAGEAAPTALRVGTFAPNPAVGTSRLTFTADAAQSVRATVVDALGRTVAVLFDGTVAAGAETALTVEAGRLAPGTYVVRVAGETFAETRRLTVVR